MVGDVLEGDELGAEITDELGNARPEVPLVFVRSLLAGRGKRLTRISANDCIHETAPRSRIEGGEVTPDRSRIQGSFFHARDQRCGGKGFPLDVADCARSEACSSESAVKPEVEPSDTRADREDVDGT